MRDSSSLLLSLGHGQDRAPPGQPGAQDGRLVTARDAQLRSPKPGNATHSACRAAERGLSFIPSADCSKDGEVNSKNIQGSLETLAAPLISRQRLFTAGEKSLAWAPTTSDQAMGRPTAASTDKGRCRQQVSSCLRALPGARPAALQRGTWVSWWTTA